MPPARTASRSSTLAAPVSMPATIVLTFPAGFAPAEDTRVEPNPTFAATSADRPTRSASAITGTSPPKDTRLSSSKATAGRDHDCDSFSVSAFLVRSTQSLGNSDSSDQEGTFHLGTPTVGR